MSDYKGKKVYLGIDVHKKTYSIVAICDKQIIKKATIEAKPEALISYCQKHFSGAVIESAYEAGFCGFSLHRALLKAGINNHVVHAASIEISARDRVKTDKRDALKIAVQLAAERLKDVFVPSVKRELYRALTRLRITFLKNRTRLSCQIKSLLLYFGYTQYYKKAKCSLKWVQSLLEMRETNDVWYSIHQLARAWVETDSKIKNIEKKIKLQAAEDIALERVYRSVPGIGPTSARILANELGNLQQFSNEKKLFSYIGLTPSEYSSGEHVRQGHISRQGRSLPRKILIQAAWTAVACDKRLQGLFEKLGKRIGHKRAIVAIARRLIGHIRACFRTGCLYNENNCLQTGEQDEATMEAVTSMK